MNQPIQTVQVKIVDLNPAPYNPRRWDEAAKTHLKDSIQRFGLVDPIIVNNNPDRHNIVIGGHFRLHIAKELGYVEVPVIYLNIAEVAKEKELNLRLNRNVGSWNFELLKEFDLNLLLDVGFDDADLSIIWDEMLEVEDDHFHTQKEFKEAQHTTIQAGDLFALGDHRVICGDATQPEVIQALLGGQHVQMIYSDPPYNIALNYSKGISTQGKYGHSQLNDHQSDSEYQLFLQRSLETALTVLDDAGHVFYWCDERYIGLLQQLYTTVGINHKRVCLWIKNNHNMTPQVAFNKLYEPCVYGTRGKPYLAEIKNLHEILNKEVGTGNRAIDDLQDLLNIWFEKRLPGMQYTHPTEKPATLHEKPIRRCTKPGDRILDSFGGSGSTLIACEQLKRVAYVAEIDPIFTQLILNRYEQLTGNKAKQLNGTK
ncbi:MAG: DNA modification methylase [Patescibacteria group bacterium]|jgi:DNA modification methylase